MTALSSSVSPPVSPQDRLPRFAIWLAAIICVAAIAFVYLSRLSAPNDLFRKDQSKTMAYTVDVIVNHRFSLPRDPIFQPATKPPLYNWLAAAFIGPTGIYEEWAQKLPSLVGGLAMAGMVGWWCRRNFAESIGRDGATVLALLAAAIWVASKSTILLIYIARPDMVQAVCLVCAWFAGHAALKFESKRDARPWAALFWLATTAAALAKGPAAVYPIVYVLFAAPLIFGDWRRLRNLSWIVGLITLLGSVGLWLACAARQDWPHVRDVLLGAEVAKRIAVSRIEGGTKPWNQSIIWFITQNTVWSYLMLGSMVVSLLGSIRRWGERAGADGFNRVMDVLRVRPTDGFFTGAAGAANLWAIVVVACLSIPKDKRMDFLLPAHPAAAILAAHFLVVLVTRFAWTRFALPLAGALFVLWQKKSISHLHVIEVGAVAAVVVAAAYAIRLKRPTTAMIVALAAVIGFFAFEVLTNTRLGIAKTSPTLTMLLFFAGAGTVASLVILGFARARLELPFLACGVVFWSFALLQNQFGGKDGGSGLPSHDGGIVQRSIAWLFDPGHTSNGTNPSVYAARFARAARKIVGDDKVVMIVRSKSPIMTLMGRHQGSYLTRADFENAKWVIAERSKFPQLNDGPQEALFSGKLDVAFGHITEGGDIYKDRVALFRIVNGVPSVDQMISIHRWVCDWTTSDANPYRSPNTGWIESPNDPPMWTPPPGDPWAIGDVKKRMSRPTTDPTTRDAATPDSPAPDDGN